jgi:CheY-like chemotaxis protein
MAEKVLIAEDNDNIRQLVMITLRKEGRELIEACNGAEALEKARAHRPDLILLDVMMPRMTGYEVCEKLRQDSLTSNLKIVFLTSRSGAPAEAAMKKAGGDAILTKPFHPGELRDKVERLLQEPRAAAPPRRITAQA